MNRILAFVLIILMSYPVFAQEETLLEESPDIGGFGGPAIQLTSMNDRLGVLVGGGGGWIIDHTFVIGGFGYGLANEITGKQITPDSSYLLNFGYGGVYLAYIHGSDRMIHYTASATIGGGSVDYRRQPDNRDYEISDNDPNFRQDAFFLLEPGISAELNVATYCRITLGASYRIISNIDLEGISNSKLGGPAVCLIVKFGSF